MAGWFTEYGYSAEQKRLGNEDKLAGAMEYDGLSDYDWADMVEKLPPDTPVALEAVDVMLLIAAYQDDKLETYQFLDLLPGASSARLVQRRLRQAGVEKIVCHSAHFDEPWMIGYSGRKKGDPYP